MVKKSNLDAKKQSEAQQSGADGKNEETKDKQNYGLRKRDSNFNLSEYELANKTFKDPNYDEKDSGYGMLIMPDSDYIIKKPI